MRQRTVQRLTLEKPLDGRLGNEAVKILNISLRGALLETSSKRKVGSETRFFPSDDERLVLVARVTRCEVVRFGEYGRGTYHIAVSYPQASLDAQAHLRQFLVDLLVKTFEAWKRNASGGEAETLESFPMFSATGSEIQAALHDASRVSRVWHRFAGGRWQAESVSSSLQPLDGFCVTTDVEPDELTLLRESYERSDETGKKLIRMLASLTTSERS